MDLKKYFFLNLRTNLRSKLDIENELFFHISATKFFGCNNHLFHLKNCVYILNVMKILSAFIQNPKAGIY